MKIYAPFTDKQTEQLTKHQLNPRVHPYTCGDCERRAPLIVTKYGLECFCGYNQKWAFDIDEGIKQLNYELESQINNGYIIIS